MSEFRYWKSVKDNQWYWHLRAGNHRIVLDNKMGHVCSDETGCVTDIAFMRDWADWTPEVRELYVDIFASSDGQFYARIRSRDFGVDVVGATETYTRKDSVLRGLGAVVRAARGAEIKLIDDPNRSVK
jgi:uncharacterized protein YegP (UPF0339 family)